MRLIAFIYRYLLSLRYKVEIKGADVLKSSGSKFILPNHQALVDPQILFSHIYKYSKVVPVVTDRFYNNLILGYLFRKIGAVPVSDLSKGSRDMSVLDTIYKNVIEALKNGQNVLLYPSGQIAGQGYEKIFNKQSAFEVVSSLPENTKVIGVRINGLWGSMWSRAWTGKSPSFLKTFLRGIYYVLANLILFVPKRYVCIEFEDITKECKKKAKENRIVFNNYLEVFYNKKGSEDVLFLKHYFYGKKLQRNLPIRIEGSVDDTRNTFSTERIEVPHAIYNKVVTIIAEEAGLNVSSIKHNSNISLDLNIDSIVMVSIITKIEEEFNIQATVELINIKTVDDLCKLATGKDINVELFKPCYLRQHITPIKRVIISPDKTIVDSFFEIYKTSKHEHFIYDKMLGSTTRKSFLLKAMVVSKIIKKEVSGKHVGILLPSLQSTVLLIFATYLAGKVPVMLNWTVGKKIVDHCIKTADLEVVLTAKTFFDKVSDLLSDETKSKCMFFEQKVKEVNLFTKLSGLLSFVLKTKPNTNLDDEAVILFTSGSESLPKAVPLTHKNIAADLYGAFSVINISSDKIFLSFLPPFHSFGFTVLTILPLVGKVKVAYTPDPTDSRGLIKMIKHIKANTILATPTFLKMILATSSGNDIKNIDLAITGAESLHKSVIDAFLKKSAKGAKIIEGYGITECSPVLTVNPTEKQKEKSVGKFIVGVEYFITDINTFEPLEQGKEGMIVVRGASIFKGYIDKNITSPFVNIGWKEYYKTGDLGYVDEDGYLFITGRLKRFIKIAGEMISLPAIENTLLQKYGSDEKVTLAVEGSDTKAKPEIVLFTTIDIDINEANAYLKECGFANIIKLHSLINIPEIPLLGTGKTDYKILKNMIV